MSLDRDAYRAQARTINSTSAWAIRAPCGYYFGGFGGKPGTPKVKWSPFLSDAKLFNGSAYTQAEKYIERIKAKDSLYIGMKIIKVIAAEESWS